MCIHKKYYIFLSEKSISSVFMTYMIYNSIIYIIYYSVVLSIDTVLIRYRVLYCSEYMILYDIIFYYFIVLLPG